MASDAEKRGRCPRCGAIVSMRVHRDAWERMLKPWRAKYHKMECNFCYRRYWVRNSNDSASPG